jgi:guanylate kinase
LAIRQREALTELGLAQDYEHVVCNREVDETAHEILDLIEAEHARREQQAV